MPRAGARHILVKPQSESVFHKKQIEDVANFVENAKQHSQCTSGKQGGALGSFGPGQMVKEFDTVVFSAEVGKVHGPVKTQFGYHLIEITKRA